MRNCGMRLVLYLAVLFLASLAAFAQYPAYTLVSDTTASEIYAVDSSGVSATVATGLPRNAGPLVESPDGKHLYVSFAAGGTPEAPGTSFSVAVIDTSNGSVVGPVAITSGVTLIGISLTASPDGTRVYALVTGPVPGTTIYALDNGGGVASLASGLPYGGGMVVSPDGKHLYVSFATVGTPNAPATRYSVSVIDTSNGSVVGPVAITSGVTLIGISLTASPDGSRVYALVAGPVPGTTIYAVDNAGGVASLASGLPYGGGMVVSRDGKHLYLSFATVGTPNAPSTTFSVAVIDTSNGSVVGPIAITSSVTLIGISLTTSPDGSRVYALVTGPVPGTTIYAVDNTGGVTSLASNLPYAGNMVVAPDGKHLYVSFIVGGIPNAPNTTLSVAVIDTSTKSVVGPVAIASRPFILSSWLTIASVVPVIPDLVDPVPLLLSGPRITPALTQKDGTPYLADLPKGRVVRGIATDGVAQVVIRIPATFVGEQFGLSVNADQCTGLTASDCIDQYGRLFDPSNPPPDIFGDANRQSVSVKAVSTAQGPMAFVAYRAPVDFVRPGAPNGADTQAAQRNVAITLTSLETGTSPDFQIQLVRPPLVLVHGLWANSSDLGDLNSADSFKQFKTFRLNYGGPGQVTIAASQPTYSPVLLANATGSSLGISYGASMLASNLPSWVDDFSSGNNPLGVSVAAVQVDIVAHSMGALVTRQFEHLQAYLSRKNYNMGSIHKVVSLGGPHLGSPLARDLLKRNRPGDAGQDNSCVRELIAEKQNLMSFDGCATCVTYRDSDSVMHTSSGAVGDLAGNGDGTNLSSAIATLRQPQAGFRGIPIAFVAGIMTPQQYAALDGNSLPGSGSCIVDGKPGECESYLFDGNRIRAQTNLDLLKRACGSGVWNYATSLITGYPASPLMAQATEQNYPRFMGGDGDGIVPFASATNAYNHPFEVLAGYVHSGGAELLGFGITTTSKSTTTLLSTPNTPSFLVDMVVSVLNTPVTNQVYESGQ